MNPKDKKMFLENKKAISELNDNKSKDSNADTHEKIVKVMEVMNEMDAFEIASHEIKRKTRLRRLGVE